MRGTERGSAVARALTLALVLVGVVTGCDEGSSRDDAGSGGSSGEGEGSLEGAAEASSDGLAELEGLDPAQAEAWQLERFAADVLPLLSARCSGCHAPVAAQLGLVLGPIGEVSSAEILRGLVDREAVVAPMALVEPGDPESSWLRLKIVGELEELSCYGGCGGPMPPAGEPVSEAELDALTQWIASMEPSR